MSISHLNFNENTVHGRLLRVGVNHLELGLEGLNDVLNVLGTMIDGDGSSAAHFTYATSKFGFDSDASTKAAYEELNSLMAKLNTDSNVSSVNAAILQVVNKFR